MALPVTQFTQARDPRALQILAKSLYRELRGSGCDDREVMAFAGELLSLLSEDVAAKADQRG